MPGAAEFESAGIVHDSQVKTFGRVFGDFVRIHQKVQDLACRTGLGVDEIFVAKVQRIADVMVDVAGLSSGLDARFSVGADTFKRRRVDEECQIECLEFFAIDFVGVVGIRENLVILRETFQEDVYFGCRVVVADVVVKTKGGAHAVSVGADMPENRNTLGVFE